MKKRRGFSLAELAVVIAILAILVALLIPAILQARNVSLKRQEATNKVDFVVTYLPSDDNQYWKLVEITHDGVKYTLISNERGIQKLSEVPVGR